MGRFESLGIPRGVTFVIGSGGKTTLLRMLADEARVRGHSAILTTTTHIHPFEGIPTVSPAPDALSGDVDVSALPQVCCLANPATGEAGRAGKLGPSPVPISEMTRLADHVLVEADGSRHHPLKAHGPAEPVVPALDGVETCTVLVVGAHGFGLPVREAAHRPELFAERAGLDPAHDLDAPATPELTARVVAREIASGIMRPDICLLSRPVDCPTNPAHDAAADLATFRVTLEELGITLPVRPLPLPMRV